MTHSPLGLLDDDPLGLFENSKPKKKRNKRNRQRQISIYDGLDGWKGNVSKIQGSAYSENLEEEQQDTLNTFLRDNRKTPSAKSVTFNDGNYLKLSNKIMNCWFHSPIKSLK